MPDPDYPDLREEDVVYEDRRISRPDASLPDWESPDTTYRPIPIVWFTGSFLMQAFGQLLLLGVFHAWQGMPPMLTVAIALMTTGLIWHHTMERGMRDASLVWRFATGAMLASFFGITALTALA